MTISEFLTAHPIKLTATRTDRNPNMADSVNMDHWRCTLTHQGRRMSLVFSMGYGHNGKAPELVEVLDCLASDASSVEGRGFEEWADDFGFDTDSRQARKSYNATVRQMRSLGRLLRAEAYSELLWNTERE